MADAPAHPRTVFALQGHDQAEAAFLSALDRGRLHHAWLLVGPEGVGKATFAYRAARRLLGAVAAPAFGLLGADPEDPVSRQVAARSHPDLLVLERETPDGKPRRVIPVDEARLLAEFFAKSPAVARHRVAIIDAADDLNVNAANAVLKTLEEPPPRGVVFMVSHAPGGLLPTIRSRCRRLAFGPLSDEAVLGFVERETDVDRETALRLADLAQGAPGRALSLASAQAVALDDAAKAILAGLPALDEAAALALSDRFRGGEGAQAFALLFERLAARVREFALASVKTPGPALDRWSAAWDMLQRLPQEVEALNLDRTDALFTALRELRAAARA